MDIDAGTIALQAPIEEGVELAGVIEDNLTRKGQGSGEQDLVDRGAKSVGLFLGNSKICCLCFMGRVKGIGSVQHFLL